MNPLLIALTIPAIAIIYSLGLLTGRIIERSRELSCPHMPHDVVLPKGLTYTCNGCVGPSP